MQLNNLNEATNEGIFIKFMHVLKQTTVPLILSASFLRRLLNWINRKLGTLSLSLPPGAKLFCNHPTAL